MLNDSLPTTLQHQLKSELLNKIKSGLWKPGQLIPSERELCAEFGISRITVREALKSMTANGYLIRKQGKGTFVAEKKVEYVMTSSFSLGMDLKSKGIDSHFVMLGFEERKIDSFLEEVFSLPSGERCLEITRLRLIDGRRYAWEKAIVPKRYLFNMTQKDIEGFGLYPSIKRATGMYPEEAKESIEAINCPHNIANDLGIESGSAIIHVVRKTFLNGSCVEYCESFLNGQRYNCKRTLMENDLV